MSGGTLLSVCSLSPETETDSPETEVAGDQSLALHQGLQDQILTRIFYY